MRRTDAAFGAVVLLVSAVAVAALVATAQTQPRAATEANSAPVAASAASAESAAAALPSIPLDPAAGVVPVDTADAAIAIALRDRAAIQEVTSARAVSTTAAEAYGEGGPLDDGGASRAPEGAAPDALWLVGVTGDIRNSYGAVAVPLDWLIVVIDARTGSIVSTRGSTGPLPDVFG